MMKVENKDRSNTQQTKFKILPNDSSDAGSYMVMVDNQSLSSGGSYMVKGNNNEDGENNKLMGTSVDNQSDYILKANEKSFEDEIIQYK